MLYFACLPAFAHGGHQTRVIQNLPGEWAIRAYKIPLKLWAPLLLEKMGARISNFWPAQLNLVVGAVPSFVLRGAKRLWVGNAIATGALRGKNSTYSCIYYLLKTIGPWFSHFLFKTLVTVGCSLRIWLRRVLNVTQLKCCGVRHLSDYNNFPWERRNAAALAPLSCCPGVQTKNDTFPPTSFDDVDCLLTGSNPDSYYQRVRFFVLIL